MAEYSQSDKMFIQLGKLTLTTVPAEEYKKFWEWANGLWTKAITEEQKLLAVSRAINFIDSKFPAVGIASKIKM